MNAPICVSRHPLIETSAVANRADVKVVRRSLSDTDVRFTPLGEVLGVEKLGHVAAVR